jgi:hypothetical protein
MATEQERKWAQAFEGKSEQAIWALKAPNDLSEEDEARFHELREAAALATRHRTEREILQELEDSGRKIRGNEEDFGGTIAGPASTTSQKKPLPPLVIPVGPLDTLLEKQIASCSGLIEQIAYYIAHDTTLPNDCINFMERIASLMTSSAGVAQVVGRLRGLEPEETRHRIIVEHATE